MSDVQQMREAGLDAVQALIALLRVMRVHKDNNDAGKLAAENLTGKLQALLALQPRATVRLYAREIYVNDVRLKVPRASFELFEELRDGLEARSVGTLVFTRQPTSHELTRLAAAYRDVLTEDEPDRYGELEQRVARHSPSVELASYTDTTLLDLPVLEGAALVRQCYFRTIDVAFRAFNEARAGRPVTIKHVRRTAQRLVDVLHSEDHRLADLLVLLTDITQWRDYESNHAANTAVLAMGLGMALGLSREELRDLGMAALLADIGNAALDSELLADKTPLDAEAWRALARHPLASLPMLAGFEHIDLSLMHAVVASIQHHRSWKTDGEHNPGYPKTIRNEPSLYAQIIAIADRCDALTTARPWRELPLPHPRAMERLCLAAGTELNPLLVEVFVRWMDTLPSGTVAMLENGDMGIVMRTDSRLRGRKDELITLIHSDAEKHQAPMTRVGADAPKKLSQPAPG